MRKDEAVWKIEQWVHMACWNWKGWQQVWQVDSAKQSANRGPMTTSIQIKNSLVVFSRNVPLVLAIYPRLQWPLSGRLSWWLLSCFSCSQQSQCCVTTTCLPSSAKLLFFLESLKTAERSLVFVGRRAFVLLETHWHITTILLLRQKSNGSSFLSQKQTANNESVRCSNTVVNTRYEAYYLWSTMELFSRRYSSLYPLSNTLLSFP